MADGAKYATHSTRAPCFEKVFWGGVFTPLAEKHLKWNKKNRLITKKRR
jgi:hypothetical protein